MPIAEHEWRRADKRDDLLTSVYEVLENDPSRAYCLEDFFRDAGPGGSDDSGVVEAFREAIAWNASRQRSKLLVEAALETLAFHGAVEKRALTENGETTVYYTKTQAAPRSVSVRNAVPAIGTLQKQSK